MIEINENYPEDLNDLIINDLELEYPVGYNYSDSDLDEKFEELKKKLNVKDIYISQPSNFEDPQFADSKYLHEVEVTYLDDSIENYLVICEVYGDPCYTLISENEEKEAYDEYLQLVEEFSESEGW